MPPVWGAAGLDAAIGLSSYRHGYRRRDHFVTSKICNEPVHTDRLRNRLDGGMATPFCFEHVFRAASIEAVFAAYFDPDNVTHQDRVLDIAERTVLELVDSGATLRRTCRVVPRRQLPALVRPFISYPLHYIETATWRRADDEIDVTIRPSLLKNADRPAITALYRLSRLSDGSIHRRYEGVVTVQTPLFSTKIERGIIAEFDRSMPIVAACTQAFLDGGHRSLSAQA